VQKFDKKPLCHILSTYVIKPVANDKNPFFIHHKNKQPIFVSNRKPQQQVKAEVSSDEDDEFETVKTHQKRIKKPVAYHGYNQNPQFPASDPSKIVLVAPGQKPAKKEETAQEEIKRVEPKAEEAKPEEKAAPKKVEEPKPVAKPAAKPAAEKPKPKKAQVEENPYANEIMMAIQQAQGGPKPAAQKVESKKEETKEQKPKAPKAKGKQADHP